MQLQISTQSILVSIFRIRLVRLSAGTYKAILPRQLLMYSLSFGTNFNPRPFSLVMFGKRFSLVYGGKCLAKRKLKLVRKNSKKLPKFFHYGFTVKFFKQKGPEFPFKSWAARAKFVLLLAIINITVDSSVITP